MNNKMSEEKNWFGQNWKWFVPLTVIILLLVVIAPRSVNEASDFATAFKDDTLYENAIEKCNSSQQVQKVLGKLSDVDKLAIVESTVDYSNNKQKVKLSVRVSGEKGKGRMDAIADRNNEGWNYSLIKIRIKNPKQEIIVLE